MKTKTVLFFIFITSVLWLYPILSITYSPIQTSLTTDSSLEGEFIDSSSEDNQYTLGVLNTIYNLNFYQNNNLGYVSFGILKYAKDIEVFNLFTALDFYVSIGVGYRQILPSSGIVGSYLFWDIMMLNHGYSHLNWGVEYLNHLPSWKLHANLYIPTTTEQDHCTGILLPEAFDIQHNELEQHYFLLKNNWGFDSKLVAQVMQRPINAIIGLYSVYDQHGKQFVVGCNYGVEYQGYGYKSFTRATHDFCKNNTFTIGYKINNQNVATPISYKYRRLCIPRERHIASPFIKTKNIRTLRTREEIKNWQRVPPRFTKFRQEQEEGQRRQREEARRKYEEQQYQQQWNEWREKQREKWYDSYNGSWKRPNSMPGAFPDEADSTSNSEKLTPLEAAYKFFSTHSEKTVTTLRSMRPLELNKERLKLLLKLHPDKPTGSHQLGQILNAHIETLRKAQKLPN